MPIYEYDCESCEKRFDFLVRNSDQTIICPSCGGTQVAKRFSVFASTSAGSNAKAGPPPAPA